MSVNVLSAAKFACKFSDRPTSPLDLQKILYLAHMFHLGWTGGNALIDGHFESWDYGPVHPVLYRKAKIFGADPVKNIFWFSPNIQDGEEKDTLEIVLKVMKDASGAKLVAMTHRRGGAWAKNYYPGTRGIIIPNEDIVEEYDKFVVPLSSHAGLADVR